MDTRPRHNHLITANNGQVVSGRQPVQLTPKRPQQLRSLSCLCDGKLHPKQRSQRIDDHQPHRGVLPEETRELELKERT